MSNVVFPALIGLKWNRAKAPQWNTKVQRATSGIETRIAFQQLPIWKWTLTYEFLRGYGAFTEYAQLADFFNDRQGAFDNFLYDDTEDDHVPDVAPYQQIGTGDATTTQFQIARSLYTGGLLEPIYNLNAGLQATKVYVNSVLKATPADYTISNGLITFTSAPAAAAPVQWSGGYYWRVRFDEDVYEFNQFAHLFWDLKTIAFVSVLGS